LPVDAKYEGRNVELDIIKGFLVLVMLFYHCASISDLASLRIIMRKIDFIHYAFLIITGFLCGYHYYPIIGSTRGKVRARLLSRSIKLIIIFAVGNVAYYFLGYGHVDLGNVFIQSDLLVLFRSLLFRVPEVAFEILYLISLFLFAVGLIISFSWAKWFLLSVFLLPAVVDSIPLLFMALGCAGMIIGMLVKDGYLDFLGPLIHRHLWIFPLVLTMIITLVPTPDRWHVGTKGPFLFFLLATPIWLFSGLWAIEQTCSRYVQKQVVLLGRYTLLAYILQVVFARVICHILFGIGFKDFTYYGISLTIAGVTTWMAVFSVDKMRTISSFWDRTYRVVFQ
jgi:hypothetical protein